MDGDVLQVLADYSWGRIVAGMKHYESDGDGTGARAAEFVGSPSLHVACGGRLEHLGAAHHVDLFDLSV